MRKNIAKGSIELFWGGRRFQDTILKVPLPKGAARAQSRARSCRRLEMLTCCGFEGRREMQKAYFKHPVSATWQRCFRGQSLVFRPWGGGSKSVPQTTQQQGTNSDPWCFFSAKWCPSLGPFWGTTLLAKHS